MNIIATIGTILPLTSLVAGFATISWALFGLYDNDLIRAYYNRYALGPMFKLFVTSTLLFIAAVIGSVTALIIKQTHVTVISSDGLATLLTAAMGISGLILAIQSIIFTIGNLRYRDFQNATIFAFLTFVFVALSYVAFALS